MQLIQAQHSVKQARRALQKASAAVSETSREWLSKARKWSPIYWRNLKLDRFKKQILQLLHTSAQPNSDEFLEAVYKFQVANPGTGKADGILGPQTLQVLRQLDSDLIQMEVPFAGKSRFQTKPTYPRGNDDALLEQAQSLGLVRVDDLVNIGNAHPFLHPKLKSVLQAVLSYFPNSISHLSEGWPSTSTVHSDQRHYNGHAMDFVLSRKGRSRLGEIVSLLSQINGIRVLDEYTNPVATTTGGHIHVGLNEAGPTPERIKVTNDSVTVS